LRLAPIALGLGDIKCVRDKSHGAAIVDPQASDLQFLAACVRSDGSFGVCAEKVDGALPSPGGAPPHGIADSVLGWAVPAFIATALVSGRAGVADLARCSFKWRVPLRSYLISLLVPPLILLVAGVPYIVCRCRGQLGGAGR
jgi:hypothetical protein